MPLILSRRQLLTGVAGAMGGVGVAASATSAVRRAFMVEPELVTVTRHHVGGGQTSAPRLRVVQLTDLHLDAIGAHEERVAAAVAAQRPDLIVFTGDSIDGAAHVGVLGEFLDMLDGGTRKLAVVGNREHSGGVDLRELERAYAKRACELLINDVADLQIDGRRVLITGLDDLIGGTPDPARALVGSEPTPNHLLLAHCPAQRDAIRWERVSPAATAGIAGGPEVDLAPYRPQWMLAGHTHGGQIAPFGLAPFRPRGSGRYVSGWYRDAVPALYVSRGIGTSVIDARYRSVPEVPVFDWGLV
ncbi:MAG: metallophosphoesterase [Gemmatimonadota bacterium]|nr:metallophosphoesterase [Gemmatimonadota bacterium]